MKQWEFLVKKPGGYNVAVAIVMLIIICLGLAAAGHAGTGPEDETTILDRVLIVPESSVQEPVLAGGSVRIFVVFTNSGSAALPVPRLLHLVLSSDQSEPVQVTARAEAGGADAVPAGGFVKQAYGFDMPVRLTGLIRVREKLIQTNTAMFFAGLPRETDGQMADEGPEVRPMTAMLPKFQPFFVNFYPYKPVYFLFGVDPGVQKSSFQISFKYKLFNFSKIEPDHWYKNAMDKIYLAYTQQSFWDLKSDSAPFEDSRYMPEMFYYDDDLGIDLPWLIGSGFQTGLQHESNGRGGSNSRSSNYAYVQPSLIFKFSKRLHLLLAPKAWVYVRNDDETNGDLADYRGYFDIESRIGDPEGFALGNHYRHGRKGGSWQFDLSYPLNQIPGFKGLLDMYIHAQYYTGYSEQLLQYNQREDIFRLGFSLVR